MFHCFVQKQFNSLIQVVRSYNALEFKDAAYQAYFQSQGILHQTSCNYRPQQNARVERKHRHVLEVAGALMLQSGLHLSLWGKSVLTTAYIINRLPSLVLNNKCPYEMLYAEPVDYTLLRSFSCLTFATNPVRSGDKMVARGIPCVFVGYPPNQKGYRLLDLKTKQIFVSRDVKFHENIFPLNPTTPKSYMPLLPTPMPSNTTNSYVDDELFDVNILPETPEP